MLPYLLPGSRCPGSFLAGKGGLWLRPLCYSTWTTNTRAGMYSDERSAGTWRGVWIDMRMITGYDKRRKVIRKGHIMIDQVL